MSHLHSSRPPLVRHPLAQSHCSCTLLAHVVWSTDRRMAVLGRRLEPWLRDMLAAKAIEAGSRLLGIGVADDHVHLLVRLPSTATLAAVVQRLKGASSYECNRRGLVPTRLRWQCGYWAQSVGPDAVVPLMQYLATQREHHACQPMSVLCDESDAVSCEPAAGGLEAP